jgi:pseudouridine kinase
MPSDSPVLLFGSSSLDIVGRLEKDLITGTSNPANIRTSFGGVARNVAENLARLGLSTILLTAVGKDSVGDEILAYTAKSGVDTSLVIRTDQYPSGFYLAVLDSEGLLAFAIDDMRIVASITPDVIKSLYTLFEKANLIFIDANLSDPTIKTLFSLAKKAKVPVCADPTSANLAVRLIPYLNKIKIITPNASEAAVLIGHSFDASDRQASMEAARSLVGLGVEIAIITLAEFGVCYATSETTGYISAIHTKVVDPTGAGDALTAAVTFGLINDIPLDDAIRLGVSAASLTLRYLGTVDPELSLERLYDQLVI